MPDAKNIALTAQASHAADEIMTRLNMPQKKDVARLGVAYAIRQEIDTVRDEGWNDDGSNFSTSGIDDEQGTFKDLVLLFYGDDPVVADAPYRTIEILMSKGVLRLKQDMDAGEIVDLRDLVPASAEQATE